MFKRYVKTNTKGRNTKLSAGFTPTPMMALLYRVFHGRAHRSQKNRLPVFSSRGVCRNKNITPSLVWGFTLVELIVSVGLFSIVMLISVGALLSVVGLNKKARAIEEVVNSIQFAVDSMARQMRVGTTYRCGSTRDLGIPRNCNGSHYMAFESFDGDPDDDTDQIVYFKPQTGNNKDAILRSVDGGVTFSNVTPDNVTIEKLEFTVRGTSQAKNENIQPRVLIIVKGYIDLGGDSRSDFNLETLVTQRNIDIAP